MPRLAEQETQGIQEPQATSVQMEQGLPLVIQEPQARLELRVTQELVAEQETLEMPPQLIGLARLVDQVVLAVQAGRPATRVNL